MPRAERLWLTKTALSHSISHTSIYRMLSGLRGRGDANFPSSYVQAVDNSIFAQDKYKTLQCTEQLQECDADSNGDSMRRFSFSSSQRQKCSNVSDILQGFKDRDEVEQVIVRRIIDPTFDGNSIICANTISLCQQNGCLMMTAITFVEDVAQRAIIQDHDSTQIWFHRAEVFDVCPVSVRAVLTIVTSREIFSLLL